MDIKRIVFTLHSYSYSYSCGDGDTYDHIMHTIHNLILLILVQFVQCMLHTWQPNRIPGKAVAFFVSQINAGAETLLIFRRRFLSFAWKYDTLFLLDKVFLPSCLHNGSLFVVFFFPAVNMITTRCLFVHLRNGMRFESNFLGGCNSFASNVNSAHYVEVKLKYNPNEMLG